MAQKKAARVLICNVGWMDFYRGVTQGDKIAGGGSYITKHRYGSEIFNFQPHQGYYYGGVFPGRHGVIKVQKLNGWTNVKRADGVTVIWCAKRPKGGGTYIVGWYKNASVYSEYQEPPAGSKRGVPGKNETCGYYVKAKVRAARWLHKDERLHRVPRGKGGIGTSHIWFPEFTNVGRRFLETVKDLLNDTHKKKGTTNKAKQSQKNHRQSDIEKRQRIERLSMEAVADWYTVQGYDLSSVANQNLGWDLEAVLGHDQMSSKLRIEVKGLSGSKVCVELTPNEFSNMQRHKDSYRICVVTNADQPPKQEISRFSFSIDTGRWLDQASKVLIVEKLLGARCTV